MSDIEYDFNNIYLSITRNYFTNKIIVKLGEIEGEEDMFFGVTKLEAKTLESGRGGCVYIEHYILGTRETLTYCYENSLKLEHEVFNLDLQDLLNEKGTLDILNGYEVGKFVEDFINS